MKGEFSENINKFKSSCPIEQFEENKKLYPNSEAEYHTILLLGLHRSQMVFEAKHELLLQETRAEHAVDSIHSLNRQHCFQVTESQRRGQEYEVAPQEHALLRSELQSRKRERTSRSSQSLLTRSG